MATAKGPQSLFIQTSHQVIRKQCSVLVPWSTPCHHRDFHQSTIQHMKYIYVVVSCFLFFLMFSLTSPFLTFWLVTFSFECLLTHTKPPVQPHASTASQRTSPWLHQHLPRAIPNIQLATIKGLENTLPFQPLKLNHTNSPCICYLNASSTFLLNPSIEGQCFIGFSSWQPC